MSLVLEDGSEHPQRGQARSPTSGDPSTGQVTLRAEVPNPKGALLAGLYVRVRLEQARNRRGHHAAAAGGEHARRRRHGDGGGADESNAAGR